ncbi:hypothetical protein RND71_009778 [Anisodus tanguticus]|uniref:Major facilitator superfamily (MFS) profile domain-containing protein n=1 Tax=Anisodus tanguticus TaxID=243964 RepID=A0AAE1SG15_9SOLA|nr:hypothetical protein RND71_009778 [Anisodus tanguticus]
MTTWMVDYFYNRVQNVISKYTIQRHWDSLNDEFGGMNDVLDRLYKITVDDLSGFHANTHIPVVIGSQLRYEVTSDPLYKSSSHSGLDANFKCTLWVPLSKNAVTVCGFLSEIWKQWEATSKGVILLTFYYGYACSQVPGGWVAQKIGGRRVLLLSFVLWSLTCAFVPLDPSQPMILVIARLLIGVAQGAAMGMLMLPSLVKLRVPQSVFLAVALWSLVWFSYVTDPPRSDHRKATAAGFGESLLPIKGSSKMKAENASKIPWKLIILSLQEIGSSKMLPYFNMFIFSNIGGVIADHLVTKRILSITKTRKVLKTVGFMVAFIAFIALMALPLFRTSGGALFCSDVALGFLALGRAGFAVNHMDIAPRYAGIVMGDSNTAGTLAGIVGVDLTGRLLEAAKATELDLSSLDSWKAVFLIPGVLCIFSSFVFLVLSTGEIIF